RDKPSSRQDYVTPLAESDMQPSVPAAEKKRFRLSDPLFARHFEIPAGDDRESPDTPASPLWSDAILIGLGGSDRRYFRVRHDGRTAVVMECPREDPDFERHLLYTGFFRRHSVPVPALLAAHDAHKRALFEDLGDASLYAHLQLAHDDASIQRLHRDVLRSLVTIHTTATRDRKSTRLNSSHQINSYA